VTSALALIKDTQTSLIGVSQPFAEDLLCLVAEAACALSADEVAAEAADLFLIQKPKTNQFLARVYLVQAQLDGRRSLLTKGQGHIDIIKRGLKLVLKALDISKGDRRYLHVIYNCSVVMWRVSRPLVRSGTVQHILEAFSAMSAAMAVLPESDLQWRAMYMIIVARAQESSGKVADALKTLTEAEGIAKKLNNDGMSDAIFRLQVYCARASPADLGNIIKAATAGRRKALLIVQCARCGVSLPPSDPKAAPLAPALATAKDLSDALSALIPASATPRTAVSSVNAADLELVAEIGFIAAQVQAIDVANRATALFKDSRAAGAAQVFSEIAASILSILALGEEKELYTKKMVEVRFAALGVMERALAMAVRTENADLVNDCCVAIWNTVLPLLQPDLRLQCKKILSAAVLALELFNSLLHELRVLFHFELSKCDQAQDLLASAAGNTTRALSMDYPSSAADVAASGGYARAWDKEIKPFHYKLAMKMSLFAPPDRLEDKAMLLTEQARVAKDTSIKSGLIERALALMAKLELPSDRHDENAEKPLAGEAVDRRFTSDGVKREQCTLWCELAKVAWTIHLVRPVLLAAAAVQQVVWDEKGADKDMILQQAQVHFIEAEARLLRLRTDGLEPGKDLPMAPSDAPPSVVAAINKRRADAIKERDLVAGALIAGVKKGLLLQEYWLCYNGAVLFLNYHQDWLKLGRPEEIYTALEQMHEALMPVPDLEPVITASVASALIDALKSRDAAGLPVIIPGKENVADKPLARAVTVCEYACGKAKPMQKRLLLFQLMDLRKALAQPAEPKGGDDPESQVICSIRIIQNDRQAADISAKLGKLWDLLLKCPANPQLCAEAAREALVCNNAPLAIEMSKKTVESLPQLEEKKTVAVPDLWRWFAVGYSVWGQATKSLINPVTQEKTDQDKMSMEAVKLLVQAATLAAEAEAMPVIRVSAQHFWNAAIPLMQSEVTRKLLKQPCTSFLKFLQPIVLTNESDIDDIELRLRLYKLLFECITDAELWQEGLKYTQQAFQFIPSEHQKTLFSSRIVFLGKLGKDTAAEIMRVKESGPIVHAKAIVTLARSTSNRSTALQAYVHARACMHPRQLLHYFGTISAGTNKPSLCSTASRWSKWSTL
jgi:hypothetical protein